MQDYINSAKAYTGVDSVVNDAVAEVPKHIVKLTLVTTDRTYAVFTAKFSVDVDMQTVKNAYSEFENWWMNKQSASYVFELDGGDKSMVRRVDLKSYTLVFKFAETE
jgi:hypothetical protein